jgi:hypothetical protein
MASTKGKRVFERNLVVDRNIRGKGYIYILYFKKGIVFQFDWIFIRSSLPTFSRRASTTAGHAS